MPLQKISEVMNYTVLVYNEDMLRHVYARKATEQSLGKNGKLAEMY